MKKILKRIWSFLSWALCLSLLALVIFLFIFGLWVIMSDISEYEANKEHQEKILERMQQLDIRATKRELRNIPLKIDALELTVMDQISLLHVRLDRLEEALKPPPPPPPPCPKIKKKKKKKKVARAASSPVKEKAKKEKRSVPKPSVSLQPKSSPPLSSSSIKKEYEELKKEVERIKAIPVPPPPKPTDSDEEKKRKLEEMFDDAEKRLNLEL